jgi:hypothetical protein
VREHTGFDYDEKDQRGTTAVPTAEELNLLRGPVAAKIAENYPAFAQRVWKV